MLSLSISWLGTVMVTHFPFLPHFTPVMPSFDASSVLIIGVRAQSTGGKTFCPKNMYEKYYQNSRILRDFCPQNAQILHNNCPKNIVS